jgi:hypothetical protein
VAHALPGTCSEYHGTDGAWVRHHARRVGRCVRLWRRHARVPAAC